MPWDLCEEACEGACEGGHVRLCEGHVRSNWDSRFCDFTTSALPRKPSILVLLWLPKINEKSKPKWRAGISDFVVTASSEACFKTHLLRLLFQTPASLLLWENYTTIVKNTRLGSRNRLYFGAPPGACIWLCFYRFHNFQGSWKERTSVDLLTLNIYPKMGPRLEPWFGKTWINDCYLQWFGGFDGSFACFCLFLQWFWALHVI